MTKESNSSKKDGDSDRPIREIIYFDLNRITSYLSQLHDGLTEYLDQTATASKQENKLGTRVNIGKGAFPLGVTLGHKDTAIFDTTTLVERKREHHAALTVLEHVLTRKEILGRLHENKPFVKHVGQPLLVDYPYMAKRLRGFKELHPALDRMGKSGQIPTTVDPREAKRRAETESKARAENQRKFDDFATIMEASGERLEFFYDEPRISVPLVRDFFQMPSEMIEHLYGSPARLPVTLVGLNITGEKKDIALEAGDNMATSTAFITNEYFRLVGKNFTYTDDFKRIVPIDLYIEADPGSVTDED